MNSYIWALLAALIWGCVPALEKLGLAKVPALAGLFYRSLGVLIGIVILFVFQSENIRQAFGTGKGSLLYLVAGGLLASVVGQVFFYQALKAGQMSTVVPIAASYPVISFLIGTVFLKEPVTLSKAGGLFLVLSGVFLLR